MFSLVDSFSARPMKILGLITSGLLAVQWLVSKHDSEIWIRNSKAGNWRVFIQSIIDLSKLSMGATIQNYDQVKKRGVRGRGVEMEYFINLP